MERSFHLILPSHCHQLVVQIQNLSTDKCSQWQMWGQRDVLLAELTWSFPHSQPNNEVHDKLGHGVSGGKKWKGNKIYTFNQKLGSDLWRTWGNFKVFLGEMLCVCFLKHLPHFSCHQSEFMKKQNRPQDKRVFAWITRERQKAHSRCLYRRA